MTALIDYWPLFGLRLRCDPVELRYPTDDDLAALAALAAEGVHPPETMPFQTPWTDLPPGQLERGVLQWHWGVRARWTVEHWAVDFVVRVGGEVVGAQGLVGEQFAVRRTVESGSWLGRAYQGQGFGTAMRQAVLGLAFDGLGALEARSAAFTDNPGSAGVSRKLGYREQGHAVSVRRGERALQRLFVLDRDAWCGVQRPEVVIEGLDACRDLFGA